MDRLFESWAGEPYESVEQLSANGSNRQYYRLCSPSHRCIVAVNADVRENEAFFYYADAMRQRGIKVPEIYAISDDRTMYLQQDLGDTTLYSHLTARRQKKDFEPQEMLDLYRRVIDDLVLIQTRCRNIDFSYAYPRSDFDRQSLLWDLNYFKYYFLKLAYIPFDEQLLENDFNRFIDYLLDEDCSFFLYRDFQARNIMLTPEGELYYIDFQGGRRGAAQYDVASLLYSAKSEIPDDMRMELLDYYLDRLYEALAPKEEFDAFVNHFKSKFFGYVLARMMQAMGAYGYRGYFEKKDYFIRSVPLAVDNMRSILERHELPIEIPELKRVWTAITLHEDFLLKSKRLNVKVFSFSYKKGIPPDRSGNGGGFVFDCRALPNPGRFEQYKTLNGKDKLVIDFLESHEEVEQFLSHAKALVCPAVENYMERGFQSLMVNFGCTGGKHRSVYCAERMADFLRNNYDIRVVLRHIEQGEKK